MATEVARWTGANLIEEARKEMEDVFRRLFGPIEKVKGEDKLAAWSPRVDVSETDNEFVVVADIPGVEPKDVEVTIHEGVLSFKGEKKEEREEKNKNYHRMERFVGSFFRQIPLPAGADEEKVTATFNNGTITVHVPKKPGMKPRRVEVKPVK
jgi:HSP20 family protein